MTFGRDHHELVGGGRVKDKTDSVDSKGHDALYAERAAVTGANNAVDNTLSQGNTLREQLENQRAMFSSMMTRVRLRTNQVRRFGEFPSSLSCQFLLFPSTDGISLRFHAVNIQAHKPNQAQEAARRSRSWAYCRCPCSNNNILEDPLMRLNRWETRPLDRENTFRK